MSKITRWGHLIPEEAFKPPQGKWSSAYEKSAHATMITDLREQLHNQFQKEYEENQYTDFAEQINQGTREEIRNLFLEFKRNLEVEQKNRHFSTRTEQQIDMLFLMFNDFLHGKSELERVQNRLAILKESAVDTLDPTQRIQMRDLINECREHLQTTEPLKQKILCMLKSVLQLRNKEIAEENNLKNSVVFYLQFVESAQKAYIETVMNQRLKDLSYERRINILSLFINKLVKISPSIKMAEIGRLLDIADHYLQQQDADSALATIHQVLKYHQKDPQIYTRLALCYELKGNQAKQIEAYQKVLEFEPDDFKTILTLAQIL